MSRLATVLVSPEPRLCAAADLVILLEDLSIRILVMTTTQAVFWIGVGVALFPMTGGRAEEGLLGVLVVPITIKIYYEFGGISQLGGAFVRYKLYLRVIEIYVGLLFPPATTATATALHSFPSIGHNCLQNCLVAFLDQFYFVEFLG